MAPALAHFNDPRAQARQHVAKIISRSPHLRLDARAAAHLARELTQVLETVFEMEFEPLRALQLLPMTSEADPGAATVEYEIFEDRGIAKIVANYADDIPTVSVAREAFPTPVFDFAIAYHWTDKDLRRAAFAARNNSRYRLNEEKPRAARRAVERALDRHAALGVPAMGVPGFLNHPSIPVVALTNGSWLDPGTTPDEILADMVQLMTAVWVNTRTNWKPDTLLLPTSHYAKVAGTRLGADLSQTILDAFLASYRDRNVSVEVWTQLDEADDGDPRAVAYARDAAVARVEIPTMYDEMPVERRNLVHQVIATATSAGTIVHRPLAVAYGDGI
jgi:hypothetical protein